MLLILYHNLPFRLPILSSYYWYYYNQKQSSGGVLQKMCSYKFRKFHKKTPYAKDSFLIKLQVYRAQLYRKNRFRHIWFICEFCETSHNTFFKEPFRRLLLHKHSFCLLSHHDLLPFQKRCYTYFPAEYFLGLIWRLGTRVSSIF